MTDLDRDRAAAFGAYAEDYDRGRPGYPDRAVDWLVPPRAERVVDVGAGTGKLTGALVARGLRSPRSSPIRRCWPFSPAATRRSIPV